MTKHTILIVDDEPTQCKVISRFIEKLGYDYLVMNSGIEVVDFVINKKVVNGVSCHDVSVMLLDLSMPDLDGLTVLKQIMPIKGNLQVIVLTASVDVDAAVEAVKCGAVDYITKGDSDIFARVNASITNAIERHNLKYQVSHLVRFGKDQVSFSDIMGQSPAILDMIKASKRIANTNIPVLIEGPAGTGKEFLARAIHGSSTRSGKPFVVVNCEFLKGCTEEDLFGREKTTIDGTNKNVGKLREANNGTIYFDKIDALKPELQSKLLSFIQDGEFIPVMGKIKVSSNARVISSTSNNLKSMCKEKKFREDLLYRLSSFSIAIPSLKDRGPEDTKLLAQSFCRDFSVNENKKIKSISNDVMYMLCNHGWEEGNVRELKNLIFRAIVLCDSEALKIEHFPQLLNKESSSLTKSKSTIKKSSSINSEIIDIFDDEGNCKTIEGLEEEIIRRLVDIYNGNISEVAKRLDIGRSTIYRKLKIPHEES